MSRLKVKLGNQTQIFEPVEIEPNTITLSREFNVPSTYEGIVLGDAAMQDLRVKVSDEVKEGLKGFVGKHNDAATRAGVCAAVGKVLERNQALDARVRFRQNEDNPERSILEIVSVHRAAIREMNISFSV